MSGLDPRASMRAAPMSALQKAAVAVTFLLAALDGFDVLAVTLAAPGISREWSIDHSVLGMIFAAGFTGMAGGALFLAPVADIFGRRPLILTCLALMGAGMLAGGLSSSIILLMASRVVAGVGIGAMLSLINPLATEFASDRHRDLSVSLMAIGYPVGGVIGAGAASLILVHFDWRSVFYLGAILAVAAAPLVWVWLPEPLSFLIERPRHDALSRVNALMTRCGLPTTATLPAPAERHGRLPISALFETSRVATTVRVTFINLLFVVPAQYVLSWLPQLVADLGFSAAEAATVSLTANLAGIAGGIGLGWLAGILGLQRVGLCVFVLFAVICTGFSYVPADLGLLRWMAILLGASLFAGMCALHAIVSRSFPDHLRASGAGLVLGIGRAGSALSPLVVGSLFAAGVGREAMSLPMSVCAIAAAMLLGGLGMLRSPRVIQPQAI